MPEEEEDDGGDDDDDVDNADDVADAEPALWGRLSADNELPLALMFRLFLTPLLLLLLLLWLLLAVLLLLVVVVVVALLVVLVLVPWLVLLLVVLDNRASMLKDFLPPSIFR